MRRFAALGLCDRLNIVRPAPARLENEASYLAAAHSEDLGSAARKLSDVIGFCESLVLSHVSIHNGLPLLSTFSCSICSKAMLLGSSLKHNGVCRAAARTSRAVSYRLRPVRLPHNRTSHWSHKPDPGGVLRELFGNRLRSSTGDR